MKYHRIQYSKSFKIISLIAIVLSTVQCSKYQGETNEYVVDCPGDGDQVVPFTNSAATTSLKGVYSSNKNMLSGVVSWSGLSGPATAIHFHGPAKAGVNRNVTIATLVKVPAKATGSLKVESIFTESQEGSLLGAMIYYDIHTATYPNGEIRGQIILQ